MATEKRVASVPQDHPRFVGRDQFAELAAVVVTYNSASDIGALIDDLRIAAGTRPIRVIVVDNQSADQTVNVVRAHDDIVLLQSDGNLGYAGGINAAMAVIGDCENVLILNPDLVLEGEAIKHLLAAAGGERI